MKTLFLICFWVVFLKAEQGPFGDFQPPPGQPPVTDDEDFSNFATNPVAPINPEPAPNNNNSDNNRISAVPPNRVTAPNVRNNKEATPPPSANAGEPQLLPTKPKFKSTEFPAISGSTKFGKNTNKTNEPKLADYLELDPSIKGLEVKNFDLPDKEIKDVVTLISKWTGKNFILDSKVRGKITIIGPAQVTLQSAYQAFLSALEANGLTTVKSDDGNFIRIIESAEARRAPVKTYSGDYAPRDDQFITRIFQLKHISADEVQREFRDLVTRQGKLFAYEPTNSIIITDTGSNIHRIKGILDVLDVKSYETTLHVIKIKNGSAKSISDMLGEIYGEDKKGGTNRSFRRTAFERTRGGGIISKVIPDDQTNSLVVLANAAGYRQLRELVEKLDVKVTDTGRIHVYYCEYAKAEDLASTLAALTGGGGAKKSPTKSATGGATNTPSPATGSSSPVTAELDGGIKVTADVATNSLVITANSSDYQTLKRVIKKLDIPRLQVFVETAILEVALDGNTKYGINVAGASPTVGAAAFMGDSSAVSSLLKSGMPGDGFTIPIIAGQTFPLSVGGNTIQLANFMGLINLLAQNSKTSILSTPQIIAMDNEKAEFKILDDTPVQSTFTLANIGTTTAGTGTIERLKTGIDIKLTPHVNAASGTIRMEIEQKVDNVKDSASMPQALKDVQKAVTSRVTNTTVVVKDKDLIVLGGLISDKVVDSEVKVPLLGDIPILGWLFKAKRSESLKTNLVILLHPRIIGTTLASAELVEEKMKARDGFMQRNSQKLSEEAQVESDRFQQKLEEQKERGKKERVYDYRNNMNDDDDVKTEPIKAKKQKNAPKRKNNSIEELPKEQPTEVKQGEEKEPTPELDYSATGE
jgi:general secretion pathway protein D